MLHGVVRVKQPRADRADLRPLHVFRHDGEPFALDHLDVVVQEEQPRAVGLLDGEIVQRRKIERSAEVQERDVRSAAKYSRASSDCALVIDHDDLVVRVACLAGDAVEMQRERRSIRSRVAMMIEIRFVSRSSRFTQ